VVAGRSRLGWYHSQPFLAHDGTLYVKRTAPDWRAFEVVAARVAGRDFAAPQPYAAYDQLRALRPDLVVSDAFPAPDDSTVILEAAARDPVTGRGGAADLRFAVRRVDLAAALGRR
jgi:hypothetical protein